MLNCAAAARHRGPKHTTPLHQGQALQRQKGHRTSGILAMSCFAGFHHPCMMPATRCAADCEMCGLQEREALQPQC